ncbi:hypothetical protein fugu_008462 [Takifugu bimaculatus]|uniref:OAR domain-containing protein n=1 Tax=Takifugu bimaculatus TaxID=433685 RepID=A0A4Z2B1J8_9TELE|nr:hypothetical protein fugu_008462 [Takifugu bimaculatus]
MVSDNLIWLHCRALFLYFHLCRYLMSQCDQVPSTNQHPSSLFFAPSATKLPSLLYNTHTHLKSAQQKMEAERTVGEISGSGCAHPSLKCPFNPSRSESQWNFQTLL